MSGRIENISTRETATFKGLDSQSILAFLHRQMQEFAAVKPDELPAGAGILTLPATVTTEGVSGGQSVAIMLAADGLPGESTVEGCSVALRHTDTQAITTLHNVDSRPLDHGRVQLRIDTQSLPGGMYHLNASVWLQPPGPKKKISPLYRLQGTGWFQLV